MDYINDIREAKELYAIANEAEQAHMRAFASDENNAVKCDLFRDWTDKDKAFREKVRRISRSYYMSVQSVMATVSDTEYVCE